MTEQKKLTIRFNTIGFRRAVHDATDSMSRFAYAIMGQPLPPVRPYPRKISPLTARQYRAARRSYAREMATYRKGRA